jgi:hypothetical protein
MSTKQIITAIEVPLNSKFAAFTKWITSCRTFEQLITMEFTIRRTAREYSDHPCIEDFKKDLADTLQMQRVFLSILNGNFPSIRHHQN